MEAPKEIKKEQITLMPYFASFIMGGASYRSYSEEHKRILKIDTSRITYTRIKKDSKKFWNL